MVIGSQISVIVGKTLFVKLALVPAVDEELYGRADGQPRRLLDTARAQAEFGFKATTPFRVGLKRTIDWYLEKRVEQKVTQ